MFTLIFLGKMIQVDQEIFEKLTAWCFKPPTRKVLGCPWKLVIIVSKLVFNVLKGLITYTAYIGVIIQLLSTCRPSQ